MSVPTDLQSIPALIKAFAAANADLANDEREWQLQELAQRIAESGDDGVSFLLDQLPAADDARRRAILLGLAFAPPSLSDWSRVRSALLSHLRDSNPLVAAEAIDTLSHLGVTAYDEIRPLLGHASPYVVASALRFLARHDPKNARPLLHDGLSHPSPIVRQTAVDELDDVGCAELLPHIRRLLHDPDPEVRQAAETAVANLDS